MRQIKLHNFVAGDRTRVRHANGDGERAAGSKLFWSCFRIRIIEGGKTQTVAERIERLFGEITVGPAGHGIAAERGKLSDGFIESDRQPPGRIVIAGKNIGDGRATFLAWIPRFEDGGGMFLSPVHGERASVGEDHDQGFSRGSDGFQKLLLRPGKIEVHAIASEKAWIAGIAFLAFELRSDANHGDNDIRLAGSVDRFLSQIWWNPKEPGRGLPGTVEVFHAERISAAGLQMNQGRHRASAMRAPVVQDLFSVEIDAVAAVRAAAQAVIPVDGRDEFARPTDRVVLRGNAGAGRNIVPFEINGCIDALQNGSS